MAKDHTWRHDSHTADLFNRVNTMTATRSASRKRRRQFIITSARQARVRVIDHTGHQKREITHNTAKQRLIGHTRTNAHDVNANINRRTATAANQYPRRLTRRTSLRRPRSTSALSRPVYAFAICTKSFVGRYGSFWRQYLCRLPLLRTVASLFAKNRADAA